MITSKKSPQEGEENPGETFDSFTVIEGDKVAEEGLSPGEARQALLDRVKSALEAGATASMVYTAPDGVRSVVPYRGSSGPKSADEDLYALDDATLVEAVWFFGKRRVTLQGEHS